MLIYIYNAMSYPLRQYTVLSTVLAMKNEEPGATAQPAGNTLTQFYWCQVGGPNLLWSEPTSEHSQSSL